MTIQSNKRIIFPIIGGAEIAVKRRNRTAQGESKFSNPLTLNISVRKGSQIFQKIINQKIIKQ